MKLFGRKAKVVLPWSQQKGFKGRHRSAIPGKHRQKSSTRFATGRRQTPRDDLFRMFRW